MLHRKVKVNRQLSIGPQVSAEELQRLKEDGFEHVINLSQKGECDQLLAPEQEREEVEKLGMTYTHFPMTISKMRHEDVDQVCQTLNAASGRVYLHCRIGQRSSLLGLLFLALRQGITYKTLVKRAEKLGISWTSPFFQSYASDYIENRRPIREEILMGS